MSPVDQVLFERWITRRDASAFTRLAEKYSAMVYAVGRRITGNTHDAEDVAQAAFEALASQRRAPKVHLGAWLHRVATYRALNHIKAEGRRAEREARYDRERPKHTEIGWDDIYELVDEAIAALPDKQRDVVVAHYLEGKTHDAIARELGISRPAVTQRVQTGVAGIRTALGKRGVAVTLGALGVLLVNGAEAAAPVALAAQLGRIALSGYGGETGAGIGLWQGMVAGLGTAKGLTALGMICCGVCVCFIFFANDKPDPVLTTSTAMATSTDVSAMVNLPSEEVAKSIPSSTGLPLAETPSAETNAALSGLSSEAPIPWALNGIVVDERGIPFPGAKVQIATNYEGRGLYGISGECDEKGNFTYTPLRNDPVYLFAIPPGFRIGMDSMEAGRAQRVIEPDDNPKDLKLVIDRGDYLSIQGTIRDRRGVAIEGVDVVAKSQIMNNEIKVHDTHVSSTTKPTDERGRYEISYLRKDSRYQLRAGGLYYREQVIQGVAPGSKNVDFTLDSLGALEGQVLDAATGEPVTDFTCVRDSPKLVTNFKDSGGRFRLDGVTGSIDSLKVIAYGYNDELIDLHKIPESPVHRVVVKLIPNYNIAGWVRDESGHPIAGAGVFKTYDASAGFDLDEIHNGTDADGHFRIDNVPWGEAVVVAGHADFVPASAAVDWRNPEGLVITLKRGGAVEGYITRQGKPLAQARIVIDNLTERRPKSSITDGRGYYRIDGLLPGASRISFPNLPEGTCPTREGGDEVIILGNSTATLNCDLMECASVTSSLEGVVSSGGAALPFVRIEIESIGAAGRSVRSTFSDGTGHYHFEKLSPGRMGLAIYYEKQCVKRIYLEVPGASDLIQDIDIESGATIVCAFENLSPDFDKVIVALFADEGGLQDTALAPDLEGAIKVGSRDGQPVALMGIPPGSYTIDAFIIPQSSEREPSESGLRDRRAEWPQVRIPIVVENEPELAVTITF